MSWHTVKINQLINQSVPLSISWPQSDALLASLLIELKKKKKTIIHRWFAQPVIADFVFKIFILWIWLQLSKYFTYYSGEEMNSGLFPMILQEEPNCHWLTISLSFKTYFNLFIRETSLRNGWLIGQRHVSKRFRRVDMPLKLIVHLFIPVVRFV